MERGLQKTNHYNRLAGWVQQQFQLDTFSNTLFLFCGRRQDRIKGLYWEGNGFIRLYKWLESGSFQWPRNGAKALELSEQQYRWLMEGLSVENKVQKDRISELEQQVKLLTEAIRLAQRKYFGASSERSSEDAMEHLSLLFNEAEVYADQWSA